MRRRIIIALLLMAGGLTAAARAYAASAATTSATPASDSVEVVQTSSGGGQSLIELPALGFTAGGARTAGVATIRVDDQHRFQPIWGVGATLTSSSTFLLNRQLPAAARKSAIAALFAPSQANLTWVGVTLGGSDFNAWGQPYSEDDMPRGQTDPGLRHFSLMHDRDTIAVLKVARQLNTNLRIIARPWTAPGWMKTNGRLDDVTFSGSLKRQYYGVYAQYFVKYLQGMRAAGIPIYAVTVQNEPVRVPASYEGMYFPEPLEAYFIRYYLRPALRRAGLATKIYGTDESWRRTDYAGLENYQAGGLDGQAWHCYTGNPDTVMPGFSFMTQVISECAPNLIRSPVGSLMANVFNDGASAAALWNIALNPAGGPVVSPNSGCPGCTGLLTVDPHAHTVAYRRDFYQLAQCGHFIEPGARRIAATRLGHFVDSMASDRATTGLHDVAITNPDGSDVLMLYNNSNRATSVQVIWRGMTTGATIPPGATTTLRWR